MDNTSNEKKSHLPLYLSILLIGGLVACYFFVPTVQNFLDNAWQVLSSGEEERIRNWVDQFGWFGPIVILLTMVAQMFLLVIPTIALMLVAILAYGSFWGSLLVLVAIFVASSVGYGIANYLGTQFIDRLIGHKAEEKMENFLKKYGFWAIFITRLNPFLSNDAISFVAGLVKMPYWKFIGATLAGILPLTILLAIMRENIDQAEQILLWASVASLIIFLAYIWWDKRKGSSKQS